MDHYQLNYSDTTKEIIEATTKFDGGVWDDAHYFIDNHHGKATIWLHDLFNHQVNIMVGEFDLNKDFILKEKPQEKDVLTFRFVLDSEVIQEGYTFGKNHQEGAVLYNSTHPSQLILKSNSPYKGVTIRIEKQFIQHLEDDKWNSFEKYISQKDYWLFFERLTPEMEYCIKELFDIQKSEIGNKGLTFAVSFKLVALYLAQFYKHRILNQKVSLSKDLVNMVYQIKNKLSDQLDHPQTIEELSKEYGMNVQKIRKSFQLVFGHSPHQYVMKERLFRAQKLVLNTDMPMSEIAAELGFSHSSHLTRLYIKEYGISPLKERKSSLPKI
ncbi:helix-turn-helix domain-containing protein [Flammeovirga yaeyamensis]|uniref:Helix-turn-helix domain-containing protein n=1 Tax=Flammeovirga yaeyamensis TaxID=367791 RepID=A0AAX1NDP3_9BACT|nr:AraC family transcriptional regulator [Flammeovirga yaeyamensis]MBB3699429.1 AraC-like DNA-binding protein [Flammeovirga yaeyamensis]NMF35313.1 helix-turn-helix transcriptional regulator [Flammeovirga yaeyamensis]QWG04173.1 helix-turn-helix domain-containing protein [Flammeovirga yaeyamensis]